MRDIHENVNLLFYTNCLLVFFPVSSGGIKFGREKSLKESKNLSRNHYLHLRHVQIVFDGSLPDAGRVVINPN